MIKVQAAMREPFRGVCQVLSSVSGEESNQKTFHGEVARAGRLAVEYLSAKSFFSRRHRIMRKSQEQSYRAQALKLFPWVCAHCGREFDGKKLNQLTVHHKDHNHHNNPPDGSNWELLCLYCHDNEHQRDQVASESNVSRSSGEPDHPFTPFSHLANLLKRNTTA
jgi:HNH endonuclease/Zn-finger in ubiquitin-hydrolases and other protein